MPDAIEISRDDARFASEVGAVLQAKLPHIVGLEKYLCRAVLVWTLLGSLGLIGIAGSGAYIVFRKLQDESVDSALKTRLSEPTGPVAKIAASMTSMSKKLSSTFETQVDSASFKVLKFGCTLAPGPAVPGMRACRGPSQPAELLSDDQSIFFVATPKMQTVQLDLVLYPVGSTEHLKPLLLEIYADAAPSVASDSSDQKGLLVIKREHVKTGADFVRDGRLRLFTGDGIMGVTVDLTPSLKALEMSSRAIRLQFRVVQALEAAPGSATPTVYVGTRGTDLFLLRTVTSAYHRIPQEEAAQ